VILKQDFFFKSTTCSGIAHSCLNYFINNESTLLHFAIFTPFPAQLVT